MMNVENDASVGKATPPAGEKRHFHTALRPEEEKMYKDCVSGIFWKAGVPFAVAIKLFQKFRSEAEPKPRSLAQNGAIFVGYAILGSFLFAQTCLVKLQALREANDRKARQMELEEPSLRTEEAYSGPQQTEDFTYPVDLLTSLNEPEGNFSSDFGPPAGFLLDDDKHVKYQEVQNTTYDELRAKHRSRYNYTPPAYPSSRKLPEQPTAPVDAPKTVEELSGASRPRKVARNKYGDEME